MRYQNIKSVNEVTLPGVTIEFDQTNDSIMGVVFSVAGKIVCRVVNNSYNLQFQRPADPKTEKVWRVSGTILDVPVIRDFDTEWRAKEEATRLQHGLGSNSDAVLTVREVEVEVKE